MGRSAAGAPVWSLGTLGTPSQSHLPDTTVTRTQSSAPSSEGTEISGMSTFLQEVPRSPTAEAASSPIMTTWDQLTIEERIEYESGWITWGKIKDWRFWLRKDWWYVYLLCATAIAVAIVIACFHHPVSSLATLEVAENKKGRMLKRCPVDCPLARTLSPSHAGDSVRVSDPSSCHSSAEYPAIGRKW